MGSVIKDITNFILHIQGMKEKKREGMASVFLSYLFTVTAILFFFQLIISPFKIEPIVAS